MLAEAIQLIRELHSGALVDHRGEFFEVDSARIWDLPDGGVPIAAAAGGTRAVETFGALADHLIATAPDSAIVAAWNSLPNRPKIGAGARAIGQLPVCWDPDAQAAQRRAHEQFRWFAGGWSVNADLPTTAGFAGATQFVRPEDVAASIPCGPELDPIVEAVRPFWQAGFTDIALVQVGDESTCPFLDEIATPLLHRLRDAADADH